MLIAADGLFYEDDLEGKIRLGMTDWCKFCKDFGDVGSIWGIGILGNPIQFYDSKHRVSCCYKCLSLWCTFRNTENMRRYIKDPNEFRFYGREQGSYWWANGLDYVKAKIIKEEKERRKGRTEK